MLEFRLTELDSIVDRFVICESKLTFVGNVKPLYFQNNKTRFKKWLPKINHVIIENEPNAKDAWERERIQRNAIRMGIKTTMPADTIVLLSDVDEIPNTNVLKHLKMSDELDEIVSLELEHLHFNFEFKSPEIWRKPKVFTYRKLIDSGFSIDSIRYLHTENILLNAGWHLSYFASAEMIRNKLQQFSHQEYNFEEFTNVGTILTRMNTHTDVLGRWPLVYLPIHQNKNLPKYWKMIHKSKYHQNTIY
jgi:beta-1,4-mannosyl-glycoprotein beta-1,4-N-acetylglucosaminyltransferase